MTTLSTPPLPLASLHLRLGAELGEPEGFPVPLRYGPVEEELSALREGAAVADLSWRGRLELLGADRLRFLHNYLTCEVKGLAPGAGAYGFFTNPQGRILSDAAVLAREDRLWVEIGPGQETAIGDHLRKYLLADRVEIRTLEEAVPITLLGPAAGETLGVDLSPLAQTWSHARIAVHGAEVELQHRGLTGSGSAAWTLWVAVPAAAALFERLIAAGARPVGFEALEALRAGSGIPRFGRDFGPDNFPQETGIDEAVSYTKGCYLGQEVVARIHYRGGVQNLLRGLVFEGFEGFEGGAPAQGAALSHEGREVGKATTVIPAVSGAAGSAGGAIGLGIVHRRAAEPGTRVEVEGGGTALVRLPRP